MDYMYTLHVVGVERSFTDHSDSGRRLQYHLPLDIIGDNKEYEVFLKISHICSGGVNTSHFIISEIYNVMYTWYCDCGISFEGSILCLYRMVHYIVL